MFSLFVNAAKYVLGNSKTDEPSIDELIERFENANCNEVSDSFSQLEIEKLSKEQQKEVSVGVFYKTGTITSITRDYVLIDNCYVCNSNNIPVSNIEKGTRINYLAYKKHENGEVKVSKILSKCEEGWGGCGNNDSESRIGQQKQLMKRYVVAKVMKRDGRKAYLEPNNIVIDLNKVNSTFVPYVGDWLKVESFLEVDETATDLTGQVLETDRIQPLRSKIQIGIVTRWDPNTGVGALDRDIIFHKYACQSGYIVCVGDKVVCDCIESDQDFYTWRCLTVVPLVVHEMVTTNKNQREASLAEKNISSGARENKNGITITNDLSITLEIDDEAEITLFVINRGYDRQKLIKVIYNDQSQLSLMFPSSTNAGTELKPNESIKYVFGCSAKFVGTTDEAITFCFNNFEIRRDVRIMVNPKELSRKAGVDSTIRVEKLARQEEYNQECYIAGVRPCKPPCFIKVRGGIFRIPQTYWNIIIPCLNGNETQGEIESTVGQKLPFLIDGLTLENYRDRFHALLYLEEMSLTLEMQKYELGNVSMRPSGEYLVLEVPGLREKRPSLIIGDRAVVSFTWDKSAGKTKYEGFIHKVKSSELLLKFNPKLHDTYDGETCEVTFKSSYSSIARCHNAVNLAINNLGPEILFPTLVKEKKPQAEVDIATYQDRLRKKQLNWFNKKLNIYQKEAVRNILYGIARPLPYVIFGPPGTGKTVTLCETILQILTMISDSRILIATPSNSSANLISERLIDSGILKPGDLVRLVAHHCLEDNSIPERLIPYCATGNLATEGSTLEYQYSGRGLKTNCTMSVLGRHRITVGTCIALGLLYNMGFPRGHFSHIAVDEAGQATEPEIMVPLTFTHSSHGQIILAGDPMQLGPVVNSKLSNTFGLGESFLARLLHQFPYQRDPEGYGTGFDPRLVTKLLINYRSLPEILKLPNELFYESELQPLVSETESEEAKLLNMISSILPKRHGKLPPAVVFHGVNGENRQDADSPSWYNPAEATQVYLYLSMILNYGLKVDDIGIIAPYQKQVRQIRDLLGELDISMPKIGSVEEFQGQERQIIILSVVRSTQDFINEDVKYALGFIASPRRFNVAITRSRALLIILGNPNLLSRDPYWRKVLLHCLENNSYTGCNFSIE